MKTYEGCHVSDLVKVRRKKGSSQSKFIKFLRSKLYTLLLVSQISKSVQFSFKIPSFGLASFLFLILHEKQTNKQERFPVTETSYELTSHKIAR